MSAPKIVNESKTGQILRFEDEQIRTVITRLRPPTREGKIYGQLKIHTELQNVNSNTLYSCQHNFNYAKDKEDVLRWLKKQVNSDNYPPSLSGINWTNLVSHIFNEACRIAMSGESYKVIDTCGEIIPPKYLVYPFAPLNNPAIVFGDGGSGKSLLAIIIYIIASLPWKDSKLGITPRGIPAKGLYLDWERDEDTQKLRLQLLEKGLGLPALELNYLRCYNSFADNLDNIRRELEGAEAEFLIIDSLAGACGGDLIGSDPATKFYNAERSLGLTSVIIAHNAKGEGPKSIYGSAIFEHRTSSVWELRKSQEVGSNVLNLGLFHRKSNLSGFHKPLGFQLTFNESDHIPPRPYSIEIETADPEEVCNSKGGSASKRILDLLELDNYTVNNIVDELEITADNAYQTLKRLKDKGRVVKVGDKWGLV